MNQKIPTRRSLLCRAWRLAERSWLPAIAFYAILTVALIAANWGQL